MDFGLTNNSIKAFEDQKLLHIHQSCVSYPSDTLICSIPVSAKNVDLNIPFKNILWVDKTGPNSVTLSYVSRSSKVATKCWVDFVENSDHFCEYLLDVAYKGIKRSRRFIVFINPHGGKGKAKHIWESEAEPVFSSAHSICEVVLTRRKDHAKSIAKNLDVGSYDGILSVGGDGLFHEVINGLGERDDYLEAFKLPVCMIPGGSGNAFSYNATGQLKPALTALEILKGRPTSFDLMTFEQKGKKAYSFLTANYGIIADCDIGTENWRFMGENRAYLGFFLRLFQKPDWKCSIEMDVVSSDRTEIKHMYEKSKNLAPMSESSDSDKTVSTSPESHLLTFEINDLSIFCAGLLPYIAPDAKMFPAASNDDGLIDVVIVYSKQFRKSLLSMFTQLDNGGFYYSKHLNYYKVRSFRFTPVNTGKRHYFALDGESYPLEPFECRVAPKLGTTLSPVAGFQLLDI